MARFCKAAEEVIATDIAIAIATVIVAATALVVAQKERVPLWQWLDAPFFLWRSCDSAILHCVADGVAEFRGASRDGAFALIPTAPGRTLENNLPDLALTVSQMVTPKLAAWRVACAKRGAPDARVRARLLLFYCFDALHLCFDSQLLVHLCTQAYARRSS
jgi:hypothetical protein